MKYLFMICLMMICLPVIAMASEAAAAGGYDIYAVAAIIAVCGVIILKSIAEWYGGSLGKEFKKYYPYAMAAFSWVEKNVPNDYGANDSDPAFAKAAHKMDLFCKKFVEISVKFEGTEPSDKLITEAKRLAAALAESRSTNKAA